jgi:lysophospholipase L1-like esterase
LVFGVSSENALAEFRAGSSCRRVYQLLEIFNNQPVLNPFGWEALNEREQPSRTPSRKERKLATEVIAQRDLLQVVDKPLARVDVQPVSSGFVRRQPRHVWLFRLLTLFSIAMGQEVLFRWEFPFPEVHGFNRISYQMMAQDHGDLTRLIEQGLVYDRLLVESEADGFSEVHSLNLYGFRGADFAIEPPRGRRRILLLGDSVTEGMGARDSATIAREFERRLASHGESAEVINLGVIAATLDHLTVLARDAITLLRPTDAVVILYANDMPASQYNPAFDSPGKVFPPWKETWWKPRFVTLFGLFLSNEPFYHRWPHLPIRFFAAVPDGTNPWSGSKQPPEALSPELFRQMKRGKLNPWLSGQSTDIPRQLSHDFAEGGSPERHLARMAGLCKSVGARLLIAYVPFCGVVSSHYAPSLVRLGMDPHTAGALAADPLYRRQNAELAGVCSRLHLPLADTTNDLIQSERTGVHQYWEYDTHPRPAGYATIARRLQQVFQAHAQ